jgi:hypothetical protein
LEEFQMGFEMTSKGDFQRRFRDDFEEGISEGVSRGSSQETL